MGDFLLVFLTILLYHILEEFEERELLDQYGAQHGDDRRLDPWFVPHFGRMPETRILSPTGGFHV